MPETLTKHTSDHSLATMTMMNLFLSALVLSGFSDAFSPSKMINLRRTNYILDMSQNPEESDSMIRNIDNDSRRIFLTRSIFGTAGIVSANHVHLINAASTVDYKAVSSSISDAIKKNPDWGPTMVRLAWHSSGTYDKMSKTGGSGLGTIRFKEELAHGGNAGLEDTAVKWMEPLHEKYGGLSYADLYTLAGVTAIKTLGGPIIPWSSGRVDAMDPSSVTPNGRLPNADSGPRGADKSDAEHLRSVFNRMGFNDQEIVALSGAHALGRCHAAASGYDGPWTTTPTLFNNSYFAILSGLPWKEKTWDGPLQYEAGVKGSLMMLPTDLVLIQDKSFLNYVNMYAKDANKFNNDFAAAFQKLEELGTNGLTPTEWI